MTMPVGAGRTLYASWSRLAAGRGRITDARFLVHELAEVGLLKQAGVDFMGRSMKIDSLAHQRWTRDVFDPAYLRAHKQALHVEYQFLADQLVAVTGEGHRMTPEVVAAVASTFDENSAQACGLMATPDGPAVKEHQSFSDWQRRATVPITISPEDANRLGVSGRISLGVLLRAIRETRLSIVTSQGGKTK